MKSISSALIIPILLVCLTGSAPNLTGGAPKQSDGNDYRKRLSKLHDKIDTVQTALQQTEGYPKRAGLIDLQVAKFFAEYIDWELEHPELMKEALGLGEYFKGIEVGRPERNRRYHFLIDHELTGSMEILDRAMARIKDEKQCLETRNIEWNKVEYEDGFFRYENKPVFFGGFNMLNRGMADYANYPEWSEKNKEPTGKFLLDMQKIGVGILGSGADIPGFVNADGSIDKSRIRKLANNIRQYGQMGFKIDVLLHWGGKKEVLEKFWPGITKYYGNGVELDIDHPGTKVMTSKVMAELMPALKDIDAIISWDLANEPFFNLKMWSPHTLRKYRNFLADEYKTIGKLNTVWKTAYRSFSDIPLPKEQAAEQYSPGQWYDMITFHNKRVAGFFEFVQSEIRKYIPDAVIHIKAQDNSSLGPLDGAVTDGIDREMLTPLVTLHGLDTRPLPVTEPRMAAGKRGKNPNRILHYDDSEYGFHWLGQSFLYDYLTSLKPYRPIVDFEYHAFSINPIRIPDIKPSHASASLWMAHLHGLIGNITWYWHRRYGQDPFPHKHFKIWFYGSMSTQPLLAAEYFQTMLKLNTFSQEVASLATVDQRPVRIFVSKPSYIHNRAHIDALHRVYEGLCFHGLRVGFVTELMLAEDADLGDCKMIVIPDAEFVSKEALKALEKAKRNGVRLVRFGRIETARDEHGLAHSPESLVFLNDIPVYDYADARTLSDKFEKLLSPITAELPVKVTGRNGQNAFGVMHRQTVIDGKRVLLLVNVSDETVEVQLRSKTGNTIEGFDMLNCENIKSDGIIIPFQGVRLISISL